MFSSSHIFLSRLQSEQMDQLLFAAASEEVGAGDRRSSLQSASLPYFGLLRPEPNERMLLRAKGRLRAVRIPLRIAASEERMQLENFRFQQRMEIHSRLVPSGKLGVQGKTKCT